MTEIATQSSSKGLESVTVIWTDEQQDALAVHAGRKADDRRSFVLREAMPNGDPPSQMLWGDDE